MTVEELIERLKQLPKDAPVVLLRDGLDVLRDELQDVREVYVVSEDEASLDYWGDRGEYAQRGQPVVRIGSW